MKTSTLAAWLLAAGIAGAAAQTGTPPRPNSPAMQNCSAVTAETCKVAHALGRGINLGNMLDAPREGDWGVKLEPAFIDLAAGSFQTVRLPVRWSNHAAPTADATLDEAFAKRVDQAVDALLAKGVYVILDMHHYTQITGDAQHPNEQAVDAAVVDTRLVNMWKQIALRYKDRSPKLLFELLNEPHGRLNGEPWNALAPKVLAAVRASNPTRIVLVGPGEWNAIPELPKLRVPADRNIIVAIHNYDPFAFTHQGVDWLPTKFPTGVPCCDAGQRKAIADVAGNRAPLEPGPGLPAAPGRVRHVREGGHGLARQLRARRARGSRKARHRLGLLGTGITVVRDVRAGHEELARADPQGVARPVVRQPRAEKPAASGRWIVRLGHELPKTSRRPVVRGASWRLWGRRKWRNGQSGPRQRCAGRERQCGPKRRRRYRRDPRWQQQFGRERRCPELCLDAH